jgi:predicted dehydrogenase
MGWTDLSSVGSHPKVQFVGFCDIDSSRFAQADQKFPGVAHFADYREMLAELGDKVDAVIVSTPDHMHAPAAMMAMHMGKHMYCQKPLAHTVWESRQMSLLAQKRNLTTQMGNQIHSAAEYRLGVKLIHQGVIGKIREVHSWVGVQGRQYNNRINRPEAGVAPKNVQWDLWLGAAPERPFAPDVYHPFKWRDWQDFGSGALGDFGCHLLDPVFGALELTAPTSMVASHDGTNNEVWPGPETVTYTFPGTQRTSDASIRIVWRDGGLMPPRELAQMPDTMELPKAGSLFLGEEGVMVLPHVGMPMLFRDKQWALSGPSEGTGTRDGHEDPDCQRHHWWRGGGARARLLRHRRAHLPVPFAADDPRSAALVLRVPAPQDGETPADWAAKRNGNAEVKAFFASGQVRPIRVHSEILRGHHRALRGQAEAIRGTQWTSEGSQRPVSGTQRPSEAIRGQPEALTGNQRAIREHPWQSFAISSTQSHSVAIKRAPGPKTATMATSRAERAPCVCVCACSQHLEATPGQSAAAAAEAAADNAAMNSAAMVAVSATRRTFALECGQQGLGLELDSTNTIVHIKPGGRAEQQGLVRVEDVILSVDGRSCAGKLMQEVMVPGRSVYVVEISRTEYMTGRELAKATSAIRRSLSFDKKASTGVKRSFSFDRKKW